MQSFGRIVRASARTIKLQRYVLGAGGAGVWISSITMHNKLASGSRTLCAAAAASRGTDIMGGASGEKYLDKDDLMLYQYKICPFCNKLKAVMDYLGVAYKTTEVNPLTKQEINFSEDYKKVPIVRMGGEMFKDSPIIIDALIERVQAAGGLSEKELAKFCSPESREWAQWADKKLAVLLFPNITRSFSESYQAFSYVRDVDSFSFTSKMLNQVFGSTAMWAAQGKIKKKYDIDDEREALFTALDQWSKALKESTGPFVGGDQPNLGDLCVFGCIKAIEGLDTHNDVLARDGIASWYHKMKGILKY